MVTQKYYIENKKRKKHPFFIHINRINDILWFKIKEGYKLELHTPETMKLYGSTNKDKKWREPPLFISINEIDNRLALQIQERNKLELQTSETMKLYGRTKQLIDKTKTGENYLFFIYIDRSNNRLVFNIKDGYKVEFTNT